MARSDFVPTARAARFVRQSSVTKKLSGYEKDKLTRSIARMLSESYREGIAEGKDQSNAQ